ncbi:MAG TPA: Hsp70 family protein, partial [Polyangiaceae bacterium]
MTTVVGIDLGTTHTVAAHADVDSPDVTVLPIPQLVARGVVEPRVLLPSMLYAPTEGEGLVDPFADPPFVEGELARIRAGEVPGRAVVSAKSWLSHSGVDRTAAILPWGTEEADLPRISPLEASARYLARVGRALAEAKVKADSIVLTVPASFDEAARELTFEAAKRVGLSVRLLEEPQAAFYDVMRRIGDDGLTKLLAATNDDARIVVVDVGGGTTDLSLLKVTRSSPSAPIEIERLAVGKHLLLGGDNMDLALATLLEQRFGRELGPARFAQLVALCRHAKETLLGPNPPSSVPVRLLASGAKLVGATLSADVTAADVEELLVTGFFPLISREAWAAQKPRTSAIVSFGLPYERDAAVTKHVAAFLARHAAEHLPNALLLNGGVFNSPRLAARIADQVEAFAGKAPVLLDNDAPDLAVARGAVAYGQALARRDRKSLHPARIIGGGSARAYYVGIDATHAVCILARGAEEGIPFTAEGRVFGLTVGKPARFDLFASDEGADRLGDLALLDESRFVRLPPLTTRLGDAGRTKEIRVALRAELTAVGTLEVSCVEVSSENPREFRLSFQLRDEAAGTRTLSTRPPPSAHPSAQTDAEAMIRAAFGEGSDRKVKDLVRDLERRLGERAKWPVELARALFDVIAPLHQARRQTADHERVFWLLAGYCIRPGYGFGGDEDRAHLFARLFAEKVVHADNPRVWQQFFVAMRRAAGGLDENAQIAMRDTFDPQLAPAGAGLKRSKKFKPLSEDDMLETAAVLERVPATRRVELGEWLLERTWTDRDPRLWTAISRLGARQPAYASVHRVIATKTAEKWLDHLLKEKWESLQTAELSAVRLARLTGDRARDVNESV